MSEFWKNFKRGFVDSASKVSSGISGLPFKFLDNAVMRSNMKYQQGLSHETMRFQSQLNQQAIDRQNEYNDPRRVAHRARLAGVDPSVLLGGTSGAPGISGAADGVSMSGTTSHNGSSSDFFARAFSGQQLKNMESQQALIDAQAGAANAQADKDAAEAENIRQRTTDIRWYNENARQLDVLLKKAGLTKAQADARIAELEKLYQEYLSADGDIEKSQRFEMFKAELDKLRAEVGDINASTALKSEQTQTEKSQQTLNYSLSGEAASRAKHYEELTRGEQISNRDLELYGMDGNSSAFSVSLLPIVRWFEDLDSAARGDNPKGLGRVISQIVQARVDNKFQNFKDAVEFVKSTWKNTFGKLLPDSEAEVLTTLVVPPVPTPHRGSRYGVNVATH